MGFDNVMVGILAVRLTIRMGMSLHKKKPSLHQ